MNQGEIRAGGVRALPRILSRSLHRAGLRLTMMIIHLPMKKHISVCFAHVFMRYRDGQNREPEPPPLQRAPQIAWLFAASLFFDNFPLNPLVFDRRFRGKLFVLPAFFDKHVGTTLKFADFKKILSKLSKFFYIARAPPLLTF